ncbi:MAG: lysylphosphatidylglycerol synthase transmembrane domain-containing protein [Chloroflexota bacterium]
MNSNSPGNLGRQLAFSLILGLLVVASLSFVADLPKVSEALASFDWRLLPAVLLLTLANYLLRFVKWHFYLGQIGVAGISLVDSLLLFMGGLSMVVTPGKVGEWLKTYLLRSLTGTPVSSSAPIVVAERLTDGLAMLLLASVGLAAYGWGWQVLLLVLLGGLAVVFLSQHRALARRVAGWLSRVTLVREQLVHARAFYESAHVLLKPANLAVAIALGLVSWFGECVAFFLVLVGLGLVATPTLLLQATFILATATLVGSVSLLPGGLAAAEGSIAGLLLLLGVTDSPAVAAAATLIIRFCTLWFGVSVGALALALFMPRLARRGVSLG